MADDLVRLALQMLQEVRCMDLVHEGALEPVFAASGVAEAVWACSPPRRARSAGPQAEATRGASREGGKQAGNGTEKITTGVLLGRGRLPLPMLSEEAAVSEMLLELGQIRSNFRVVGDVRLSLDGPATQKRQSQACILCFLGILFNFLTVTRLRFPLLDRFSLGAYFIRP
ncbi:hypothetical protein NDU88_006478 [Pleurodeles waltl]|uniref:Uncharacterized protein n=1 Tax=Pleurodeles waltl TaxID=8319 RepID=A0AAV7QNP8_PLEWA|nr:hypothetical protein NDU88_006478 [Pleurodeles waltl]